MTSTTPRRPRPAVADAAIAVLTLTDAGANVRWREATRVVLHG